MQTTMNTALHVLLVEAHGLGGDACDVALAQCAEINYLGRVGVRAAVEHPLPETGHVVVLLHLQSPAYRSDQLAYPEQLSHAEAVFGLLHQCVALNPAEPTAASRVSAAVCSTYVSRNPRVGQILLQNGAQAVFPDVLDAGIVLEADGWLCTQIELIATENWYPDPRLAYELAVIEHRRASVAPASALSAQELRALRAVARDPAYRHSVLVDDAVPEPPSVRFSRVLRKIHARNRRAVVARAEQRAALARLAEQVWTEVEVDDLHALLGI